MTDQSKLPIRMAGDSAIAAAEGRGDVPGGQGRVAKAGAPAGLTNALVVNGKEAIDKLWKARGYVKMTWRQRSQRAERLGYKLDKEEALVYVVTSALDMPLLSGMELQDFAAA